MDGIRLLLFFVHQGACSLVGGNAGQTPHTFSFLSRPYAMAAAVGSLMMRSTSRPAIVPASLVACRWLSLKYAAHAHGMARSELQRGVHGHFYFLF
jgi:hypothetical protein